jgi:5-methylcytosine-specific restriction protein A
MARTQGHGNAKWTRDETILALNLYFLLDGKIPSKRDVRIQRLSQQLIAMSARMQIDRKPSYRNADGVVFKLQNIRQIATGKGLGHTSAMDRAIWSDFHDDQRRVEELAKLIHGEIQGPPKALVDVAENEEFIEGRILTATHMRRERDPRLRDKLLAKRRRLGSLRCDICEEGSSIMDSQYEDAQFESHHIVPLGGGGKVMTRVADLSLLCANCHRLLHRMIAIEKRWIDVNEARKILVDSKQWNTTNKSALA